MDALLEQVRQAAASANEAERKIMLDKLHDIAESIGKHGGSGTDKQLLINR